MLTVASYSRAQLGARLADGGMYLQTGAFVTCVKTTIARVADGIGLLYADYPVLEETEFADFYISLHQAGALRRWFRPQVRFEYDGMRPFKPLPLAQAFPMFEWILNWCVSSNAHRYLCIHAAVVEKNGNAVILPAPPGSGKSTLCAALVSKGWRLLSDELTLVRLDTGELVPLPRPISLKNASIDIIRRYAPDAVFSPVVDDTVKGSIAHLKAPADSVVRAGQRARPAWVIFPRYAAGAPARLEPIAPARAFMRLAENAFNYSMLAGEGFAALADVIDASDSYEFTYSVLDDAIDVFARLTPPGR